MGGSAISAEERARIVELLADPTVSRNEIARRVGRSVSVVTRVAREEGVSFDRAAQTAEATKQAAADLRRRLTTVIGPRVAEQVERMQAQLFAPCTVYNFGGKDNTFESRELDEPDFRAKRDIWTSIGIGVDKLAVIVKAHDAAEAGTGGEGAWAGLELVLRRARGSEGAVS